MLAYWYLPCMFLKKIFFKKKMWREKHIWRAYKNIKNFQEIFPLAFLKSLTWQFTTNVT